MASSGAVIMGRPDDPSGRKRKGKLRLKLFLLPDYPTGRRKKRKEKLRLINFLKRYRNGKRRFLTEKKKIFETCFKNVALNCCIAETIRRVPAMTVN
jgi:hypothetical protein